MIIGEVASLAHAHGVQHSISVGAARRVLAPPVLTVAARAHVLCIVLSAGVGAACDEHHLL